MASRTSTPSIEPRHSSRLGVALASVLTLGLVACQESKTCEKQRLDLWKSWQEVNKALEEQKLAPGSDEAQLANIQKKVDVLQSAFATPQVTWDSASKNKEEATTLLTSVGKPGIKTEMLRASFQAAGDRQSSYYETCH
jgi:hypothetical protein